MKQHFQTPFNEEFCTHLEHRICDEFLKSTDPELKGFWCDGVSWFHANENHLTKKQVNNNRKIETKMWIGKDGQTEFEATIHLGPKALSRYARGLDLISTIPKVESNQEWVEIDVQNKTINISLY